VLALELVFWAAAGLIVFTHLGYPLLVGALGAARRRTGAPAGGGEPPRVSLIVAAHDEEASIAARVANALALDYPRDRLELIVASDGSADRTAQLAREAGADLVLDLPRAGKTAAQNAAAERAAGEVLAFSDANSAWAPDALRRLAGRFAEPRVGYVCGSVDFLGADGDRGAANQEGVYWRWETWLREGESALGGVTAGNGAIYAVRREAYPALTPTASHDLSLPFALTKRGWRCVHEPTARAEERMVPTLEGEFARKRRMMRGVWDVLFGEGMLSPRGYPPLYAFQVFSHRLLRYASPLLHLVALAANVALLGEGPVYAATLALQAALLAAAALAGPLPARPLRIARYYVLVTASIAAGLWDRLRLGPQAAWERAEGAR
jgi:cellulose synthase/poly-beta-1,6-N-acetylglucosamine synthase-like glycosyltransferase